MGGTGSGYGQGEGRKITVVGDIQDPEGGSRPCIHCVLFLVATGLDQNGPPELKRKSQRWTRTDHQNGFLKKRRVSAIEPIQGAAGHHRVRNSAIGTACYGINSLQGTVSRHPRFAFSGLRRWSACIIRIGAKRSQSQISQMQRPSYAPNLSSTGGPTAPACLTR